MDHRDKAAQRHSLLVELLALSEAQEARAVEGRPEKIEELHDRRSAIVSRLLAMGTPPPEPVGDDLLARVRACDARCIAALAAHRDAVSRELRAIDAGRGALSAYAAAAAGPRFQDREA